MTEKEVQTPASEGRAKEPYHEPLLLKHEPLLDITGVMAVSTKAVTAIAVNEGPQD